jgi:hypothetical protein
VWSLPELRGVDAGQTDYDRVSRAQLDTNGVAIGHGKHDGLLLRFALQWRELVSIHGSTWPKGLQGDLAKEHGIDIGTVTRTKQAALRKLEGETEPAAA